MILYLLNYKQYKFALDEMIKKNKAVLLEMQISIVYNLICFELIFIYI